MQGAAADGLQGAYGQFDWNNQRAWREDEPRVSRIVFIGRLDAELEDKLNRGIEQLLDRVWAPDSSTMVVGEKCVYLL